MEAAAAAVTLSSTVRVSKEKVNDYISIKKRENYVNLFNTDTYDDNDSECKKKIQLDRRWRWWKIIIHIVIIIITINNEYFYSMKKKILDKNNTHLATNIFFGRWKKNNHKVCEAKEKKIKKILLQLWTMKVFFFFTKQKRKQNL